MTALYSLHNVSQRFGPREVLRIDSLEIESGEIYGLLGSNGAGKTTLMRILAFLDAPASGDIRFKGRQVPSGEHARFRPGVVWVPQFPVLFTGSLGFNIEYPMALKGVPAQQRRLRARELMERCKLEHLANIFAPKLSGGEAQRAAVCRALAAGAEVLLLDEPTANVDQRSLEDFILMIRELWEEKKLSLFITTHNSALAAALCRKQIFLVEGVPARRYLLPDGSFARFGSLICHNGNHTLRLEREAAPGVEFGRLHGETGAVLRGVHELASGITLNLELDGGAGIEVLLQEDASMHIARSLTLGAVMYVSGAASK